MANTIFKNWRVLGKFAIMVLSSTIVYPMNTAHHTPQKSTQNEDTRVKIPTILHLMRLGFSYLSLKNAVYNEYNIFTDIFKESISKINTHLNNDDIGRLLTDIGLELDNNDLGQAFFNRLQNQSGIKLIDFDNFNANQFHIVAELPFVHKDEEFRPDITVLINGMPLVFIEVKKPNNQHGLNAEQKRINERFKNPLFRRFANLVQLMIFSNNQEYNDNDLTQLTGAYYASSNYGNVLFNAFKEEHDFICKLNTVSKDDEIAILKDLNKEVIFHNQEYQTNKDDRRPTNRICTSLLSKERLKFILRYAFCYVQGEFGIQKHIMRYPQIFASLALLKSLNQGVKKGIIWHTQGSGKTAFAFYNVKILTDYFKQLGVVPKFYFIVDRIDLLNQASSEFKNRGLTVHSINDRSEFISDIRSHQAIHNHSGNHEMTVVNIQRFANDNTPISPNDYGLTIQRIYFLDEVHRSYNPKGSFLASLQQSDTNAIKIGLTGTPLIGDVHSTAIFGDYIHKYYYNQSISDGYTLRLIREAIENQYKIQLQQALAELQIEKGSIDKKALYAHEKFVLPMLKYIVDDFEKFRQLNNDNTLGAMVICDSSEQAKLMHELFQTHYVDNARPAKAHNVRVSALILHDTDTKKIRDDNVKAFKSGKIDILFVYNMLLTGFDAPRLKKLYLGRMIKAHNLLQALTRVNRTYKYHRYGYVVDFADISKEFDKTNKAYFDELKKELGDNVSSYHNLFKSNAEIEQEISEIQNALFEYDTDNAELFCDQLNEIHDIGKMREMNKIFINAKELYNIARFTGNSEVLNRLDFEKLLLLARYSQERLNTLNEIERLKDIDNNNILNIALEDVAFKFIKKGEHELKLADDLKDVIYKTREAFNQNFDHNDPEFLALKEELKRIFKEKNLSETKQITMQDNMNELNAIYQKIKELNRKNDLLVKKYKGDKKYVRMHKRLDEKGLMTDKIKVFNALCTIKSNIDEMVLNTESILDNLGYFERQIQPNVIKSFKIQEQLPINIDAINFISGLIIKEYQGEGV